MAIMKTMPTSLPLKLAIALLMVDSIIELSFISSTVSWLHSTASGTFTFISPDPSFSPTSPSPPGALFPLRGEPAHLLVDQGHTSNGAAGTAFVLIGLGGIVSLFLRNRAGKFGHAVYYLWVVCNVLALMLTIGALGYVFAVTNRHAGQHIDVGLAQELHGRAKYGLGTWTPQNWFAAMLKLRFADDGVRADVASHYRIMRGWQYNLIPMFLVQLVETVLAVLDCMRWRRQVRYAGVAQGQGREKVATSL